MRPQLKAFKVHPDAIIPQYATESSACFDIHACLIEQMTVKVRTGAHQQDFSIFKERELKLFPGYRALVPTNLIFDIPLGYSLRLHPRSGLAWKNGITLANAEGVVDEDYVEPVFVVLHNTSGDIFTIKHGDRICQAELTLDIRGDILEVSERPASKTSRNGGFGSTGK